MNSVTEKCEEYYNCLGILMKNAWSFNELRIFHKYLLKNLNLTRDELEKNVNMKLKKCKMEE